MFKKGAGSHIEMVISFGMFLLFVFLMLVYIRPIRNQGIGNVLIDSLYSGIKENASVIFLRIPLAVNNEPLPCFIVPNPFDVDVLTESRVLVKDSSENSLKFRLQNIKDGKFDNISIEGSSKNLYYLYYSNETFNSQTLVPTCPKLNSTNYSFSTITVFNALSKKRLQALAAQYTDNYELLKTQFHFPQNYDFVITVNTLLTNQQIISMSRNKPKGVEVNAIQIPVEVLDENGLILKAIINIQVW